MDLNDINTISIHELGFMFYNCIISLTFLSKYYSNCKSWSFENQHF